MPQQQIERARSAERRSDEIDEEVATYAGTQATREVVDSAERTVQDIDAILDDIDGALEANAEDFVKGFKQIGGE